MSLIKRVIWVMVETDFGPDRRSIARFEPCEHEDSEGQRFNRLPKPEVIGCASNIDWAVDVLANMTRENAS
jgi:hypothetical protein